MSNFLSWAKSLAAALLLVGLVITAIGAFLAARGVIISEQDATDLASTKWGINERLRESLLDQSLNAKWGLMLVVFGTAFQIAGTILSLCPTPVAPIEPHGDALGG